jgi:hypothetical protein
MYGVSGDSMMGINALDGFLPRRCKERHVLIKEMVACLDDVPDEPGTARPQRREAWAGRLVDSRSTST